MLENISYFQIFGQPLILYSGILTLLSFSFTGVIAILNKKSRSPIPLYLYPRMTMISLIIAIFHGMLITIALF